MRKFDEALIFAPLLYFNQSQNNTDQNLDKWKHETILPLFYTSFPT